MQILHEQLRGSKPIATGCTKSDAIIAAATRASVGSLWTRSSTGGCQGAKPSLRLPLDLREVRF